MKLISKLLLIAASLTIVACSSKQSIDTPFVGNGDDIVKLQSVRVSPIYVNMDNSISVMKVDHLNSSLQQIRITSEDKSGIVELCPGSSDLEIASYEYEADENNCLRVNVPANSNILLDLKTSTPKTFGKLIIE